jgi:hypothetical protein
MLGYRGVGAQQFVRLHQWRLFSGGKHHSTPGG